MGVSEAVEPSVLVGALAVDAPGLVPSVGTAVAPVESADGLVLGALLGVWVGHEVRLGLGDGVAVGVAVVDRFTVATEVGEGDGLARWAGVPAPDGRGFVGMLFRTPSGGPGFAGSTVERGAGRVDPAGTVGTVRPGTPRA